MPFLGHCHKCGRPLSVTMPDDDEFTMHPENSVAERMGCVIWCVDCMGELGFAMPEVPQEF